jgi:hypothetical protein
MIALATTGDVPALVRHVVLRSMADADRDTRSQDLVHRCASAARRDGLRPEQLLVAIRDAWRAEPARQETAPEDYDRLLTTLINAVLDAYYAKDAGAPIGS